MCEIMQQIRNEGIAQGQRQLILLQYRDGKLSLQDACTYSNLSEDQFLALEQSTTE